MISALATSQPVVTTPHYLHFLRARRRKQLAKLSGLQADIRTELSFGGGRRLTPCTTAKCPRSAAGSFCLMCLAAQLGIVLSNKTQAKAYVADLAQLLDAEQAMQEQL